VLCRRRFTALLPLFRTRTVPSPPDPHFPPPATMTERFCAKNFRGECEGGPEAHQPVPILSSLVGWIRGAPPAPATPAPLSASVGRQAKPGALGHYSASMGNLSRAASGSPPREMQQPQQIQASPVRSASTTSTAPTTPTGSLGSRSSSPPLWSMQPPPLPHRAAPFKL